MPVSENTPSRWLLPLAILIAMLVRFPFWAEAWRTPLDADTAIIGLMARHPASSLTMWGQPYGSPLDAWLAAPILALMGWTPQAMRVFYFVLGLALVPMTHAMGKRLHPGAAFPAALLMACPPAYYLLLSAMPPPLYPTTLLLCGGLLILAIDIGERTTASARSLRRLVLWGALAGLALWTHLVAASAVAVTAAYILVKARARRTSFYAALLPLLVASSPVWIRAGSSISPTRLLRVADPHRETIEHLRLLTPDLHLPLGGILGIHAPIVADSGEHVVSAPRITSLAVVTIWAFVLVGTLIAARRSPPARMLLIAALLAILAFMLPLRARPNTIRYMTPLYVPLAALAAWTPVALSTRRRAAILALSLAALNLAGASPLLIAWHRADRDKAPFLLPDLSGVRRALENRGIRRAYASYGPAYRLTYESGERIIVSQPRNERFPRMKLPYHDEVRFAKNVAWILTPAIPSDLPAPDTFESALRATGGTWRRLDVGPAVLYFDFAPSRSSKVMTIQAAGCAGNGDPGSTVTLAPRSPLLLRFARPVKMAGLAFVDAARGSTLPAEFDVDVSEDGKRFERVHERRRRGYGLWWANGHPEYVTDPDFCVIDLDGQRVGAIRVTTPEEARDGFGEILLHVGGDDAANRSWMEWLPLDLTWNARRQALAGDPRRDREDWHYRSAIAQRQ
ncbi:MAG: hypothetical protein JXO72_00355 [Vicinamibacteria bacterium]|nr:hypothetical protein [Vicinamibacteria bacterium]